MSLGIFDSGIGGEAVAQALERYFPDADILTVNDHKNVPYGEKSPQEVVQLTRAAIQPLLDRDIIVIACNTATTLALPSLRELYPHQRFIGIEPMLKPAALLTKTGIICVCATPATLASTRYDELKQTYARDCEIIEPDCSAWASMIEQNTVHERHIRDTISPALDRGADVIVLGCTHYHWIKSLIQDIAGDQIVVLEPSEAIAQQVSRLLIQTEPPVEQSPATDQYDSAAAPKTGAN